MEGNQVIGKVNLEIVKGDVKKEDGKKEKVVFDRLDCIFVYVLLVAGFCFVRFTIWNPTGIFTTLMFMGIAFACRFYLKKRQYKLNPSQKVNFTLIILFSLVFTITANSFIKFLNAIFILILGIYWVFSVGRQKSKIEKFFLLDLQKAVLIMPFISFGQAISAIVYSSGKSKTGNNIKLVLLGLVVTIPLTLMVALLLISADSGVEAILSGLFDNVFEKGIIFLMQLSLAIPVTLYMFGMLYSSVKKVKDNSLKEEEYENKLESMRVIPNLVLYSGVTPVCILYVLFFVLQLQYFISAFMGVLPQDYSYAEYARKGFFELTVIAVINILILLVLNFTSKQSGQKKTNALKFYSLLISVFTLLLIATALSKMIMYINNYGLTQLRVYSSWFMLLLAVLNILIILKQFKRSFNFIRYGVITFILFFGILSFSKVDGIIARYNIKMYQAGYLKELDVDALCRLSDDAYLYVLENGLDAEEHMENRLHIYYYNPYSTYNVSSYRVKKLLEGK